jgi:hypothetical protein
MCLGHLNLMDAVAQELLLAANEYFLNEDSEKQAVPELLGHIVGNILHMFISLINILK